MKLFFFLCLFCSELLSAVTLKVGLLAPEGTTWADGVKQMAKEIEEKTKGEVKFKLFLGGSQGDEKDVYRKIKIGQLQGGMFTGKTLGDIYGDFRLLEIPFTFGGDRAKAYHAMTQMGPFLDKGFYKAGFKNLGYFELGMVYYVAKKKSSSFKELRGVKIWSWEGDPLVAALIDSMGLVSVPLSLPDVLSSLSTGVIEGAYSPPMAVIALQWSSKIKYLLDFPISYSGGAFLITEKAWKEISPSSQKILEEVSRKSIETMNKKLIIENEESLKTIKSLGVEFIKFTNKDIEEAKLSRRLIINRLEGKVISKEGLLLLEKYSK